MSSSLESDEIKSHKISIMVTKEAFDLANNSNKI